MDGIGQVGPVSKKTRFSMPTLMNLQENLERFAMLKNLCFTVFGYCHVSVCCSYQEVKKEDR